MPNFRALNFPEQWVKNQLSEALVDIPQDTLLTIVQMVLRDR